MIKLTLLIGLLFLYSFSAFSKPKFTPSIFEVTPLNSPVKEATAKFSLKLPVNFKIDKIKVKIVNAFDLKKDQKKFEDTKVINNNELHLGVSKLPPGFYRLYVKVIDHGSKKEHEFKTSFHDFVRFVIDETMDVPMPDPKKDAETVAGIDVDQNGIPDRVQRYINETYSNNLKLKLAVNQFARAEQLDLINADNKELSIQAAVKGLDSLSCLSFFAGTELTEKIINKLPSIFLNTKDRIVAEMRGNQNFNGQSYHLPDDEERKYFCDFDVN